MTATQLALLALWPLALGCGERPGELAAAAAPLEIQPGRGIGPVRLGMRRAEVEASLGSASTESAALPRLALLTWEAHGLEVLFTSPVEGSVPADGIVIAVSTLRKEGFSGAVRPGLTRAEAIASLGPDALDWDGHVHAPSGISLELRAGVVTRVGVSAPYTLAPLPPPMQGPRVAP